MVLLSVLLPLALQASAQDSSTPEERAQWIQVKRSLEGSPLDADVDRQGEAALNRLMAVHDIHVPLCQALFNEFRSMKYAYAHAITRQYMIASAVFMIENPDKASDTNAMNLAAVESTLKSYQAILQQKPDAKAKSLEDLLKKQSQGKLPDALQKQCR